MFLFSYSLIFSLPYFEIYNIFGEFNVSEKLFLADKLQKKTPYVP